MRAISLVLTALTVAGTIPATPAEAFPFGRRDNQQQQQQNRDQQPQGGVQAPMTPPVQMPGETAAPGAAPAGAGANGADGAAAVPQRQPASREERLAAASLDLVRQADFWQAELEINPRDTEAALNASRAFHTLGGAERSAAAAAIGIQADPNNPRLWEALGRALLLGQQLDAAVQALTKSSQLDPNNATVHSLIGVAYDQLGRPDLAAGPYQQAMRLAPNDPVILTNYGLSRALAGDLPGAESLLRLAAADPAAPPQARQNLALVVGLQGRIEESERIAILDLPPAVAAENAAYLRAMLNGSQDRWRGTN